MAEPVRGRARPSRAPRCDPTLFARDPGSPDILDHLNAHSAVIGKRVLVVENRFIIAEETIDLLLLLRCEPVGPAATLPEALDLIEAGGSSIDAALLDIDLEDDLVYPAAELLRSAATPFAFATGFNDAAIPRRWSDVPRLEKPYGAVSLCDALDRLLGVETAKRSSSEGGEQTVWHQMPAGKHPADPRFEQARKRRERQMEDAVLHKWRNTAGD